MENEITESAVTSGVVDHEQTETEPTEIVETESVESEVATETVKEIQSQEENSKFAEVRRKAEQAGRDKFISDNYGKSHGIHTEAEFNKAMAEQKQRELEESVKSGEVDPRTAYEQMKANDPDFQRLQKINQDNSTKAQIDALNSELKELDININIKSLDDIAKLDNVTEIIGHVKNGKTLTEAYFLANKKQIIEKRAEKVQADTLQKVKALEGASPGSLNNPSEDKAQSIYSLSDADFKKMQEDVMMGRRK